MSKTIWYISKYVVPKYAGKVGARGYLILREMAKSGHECIMFCSDSNHLANPPKFETPSFHETVEGVSVNWVRTRQYDGANTIGRILSWIDFEWRLWRLPKKDITPPDVVIVSSLSLLSVINGLWLKRRYKCKFVMEVRDIWPLSLRELRQWSKWHPVVMGLGFMEWLGYRFADLVVGTMPNLKEHVTDVLGYERSVGCIPQGVDETLLTANDEPLEESYFEKYVPENKFILAYAGTIGVANAMDTFFETARAMQERDNIHFLVLGDGYMKAEYVAQCTDLDNVTFAPAVPKAAVQSVLTRCDALYLSSPASRLLQYGQSLNKLIDYMLASKPVIASYSGFPSMINEADCGSFVAAGDASALSKEVIKYADMPTEDREKMGRNGREWILNNRKFSDLAADYIDLIDAIDSK